MESPESQVLAIMRAVNGPVSSPREVVVSMLAGLLSDLRQVPTAGPASPEPPQISAEATRRDMATWPDDEETDHSRDTREVPIRVIAFHNVATDEAGRLTAQMDGYQPGHPLVPVHRFPETYFTPEEPLVTCERVYRLLNVGHDPDFGEPEEQALIYRENKNRSLSKGDVLVVGDDWWACASAGWEKVPAPKWLAVGVSRHGTRSLPKGRTDYPLDYSHEG